MKRQFDVVNFETHIPTRCARPNPEGMETSQAGVSTPARKRGAAAEPRRGGTGRRGTRSNKKSARVRAQKKGSTRKD